MCVFFFASCCDFCPTSEQIVKVVVVLHIVNKTAKRWTMTVNGVSRIYVTRGSLDYDFGQKEFVLLPNALRMLA